MIRWRVNEVTGCWDWAGAHDRDGYGRLYLDGKRYGAHRWSYEFHVGPIPVGLTIDHLCFNRGCVNPAHLRPLTHAENAGRQRCAMETHCKWGHEFTVENTYLRPIGSGKSRQCRTCQREAVRRYQERLRKSA